MNWYIVKLVFNIRIEHQPLHSQFDEQCRTISAASEEEALNKATTIGQQEEGSFINDQKRKVVWKFIDVLDIIHVKEWKDGSTIYATTLEKDDGINYERYVLQKGNALREKYLVAASA